ncbi:MULTISPECIES: hypothetical protein [Streptomyces]|uniref:hypothetical protein n=1 Tax=Streptomyces TaxID=1883 RepID=UPI0031F65466
MEQGRRIPKPELIDGVDRAVGCAGRPDSDEGRGCGGSVSIALTQSASSRTPAA